MNRTLTLLVILLLVIFAVFRQPISRFIIDDKMPEEKVEINTDVSYDQPASTVEFTEAELEWLAKHGYSHLANLVKDDERLRIKAFISLQQKDEDDMARFIDSIKTVHPTLKGVDLTKLPETISLPVTTP